MRPGQEAPPTETPAALAYRRDQMLLRALHKGLSVTRAGRNGFVHTIRTQRLGGGVETDVYLAGDSTPYPANQITLLELPE